MEVSVKTKNFTDCQDETGIVFVGSKKNTKGDEVLVHGGGSPVINDIIKEASADKVITGGKSELTFFRNIDCEGFSHLLVVGVGSTKDVTGETFRRAAGSIFGSLNANKVSSATICTKSISALSKKTAEVAQALSEGFVLSSYKFDDLKSKKDKKGEKKDKDRKLEKIHLSFSQKVQAKQASAAIKTGKTLAEATNFAKWLGDMPGNLMTPKILASKTQAEAKGSGLRVTVWDKERIKKEKMECLLGVAKGSTEHPRMIIMEYKGAAASKKPVCFVGKGLTFDSGGISIKPSPKMEEMKYDMCGGAYVIGTMLAIARLKLKVNAIGIVAASENMPGPAANKPGDVLKARNGKTIEVNNTDAEGRLILADALSLASEKKPAVIVDAATLTGAMTIALGDTHTGYYTYDDKLSKKIENASKTTGERVWRLPIAEEFADDMKGNYGDLSNISALPGAGSGHAAIFLHAFVDNKIPWAHFDIAGTSNHTGHRLSYAPRKGASGSIVRTFVEIAKTY